MDIASVRWGDQEHTWLQLYLEGGGNRPYAVPNDPENRYRAAIEEWAAAGGVVEPWAPSPPAVPDAVEMRQARLALLAAGRLSDVDAAIAAAGPAAFQEWEYGSRIRRSHPLVQALGPALGWSEAEIDQLFIAAAAIE